MGGCIRWCRGVGERGGGVMYTIIDFKTRKALKEEIARGGKVGIFQPNNLFNNPKANPGYTGTAAIEGPHYPKPHRWYAEVEVVDGAITKVI